MNKVLHGYAGNCAPAETGGRCSYFTFSVGVFPLIPKAGGKGTKRGKTLVRVQGYTEKPEAVYSKAREIISLLDAGKYDGPKLVRV